MGKSKLVMDTNYTSAEAYDKPLFGKIKERASEGLARVKNSKLGKFIYSTEVEGEIIREVKEDVKNTAKGIYHLAKETPRNLTDKDWYYRNRYYLGSMAIPIGASIGIGLLSTTNHIKLDEILNKSPYVASKLREGLMTTYGIDNTHDIMNLGSLIPYVRPSMDEAVSFFGFGDRSLTFAENAQLWWHNHGGAYLEHVIPWASWGAGTIAVKRNEKKKP